MIALSATVIGVSGLLLGALVGYATRRARLCTFGAIEDAVGCGDWRRLKVFGLALALAILVTQALIFFTRFDPSETTYLHAQAPWLSVALGSLMFGLGMALVGTCAFGSLVRLGGGDMRALVTLLVFGLVAMTWLRGHLAALRIDWLERVSVDLGAFSRGAAWPLFIPPQLLFALLIATFLLAAVLRDRRLHRAPRLIVAGVVIGLAIPAGWLLTGVLVDDFEAGVRVQSLSFVAPVARVIHSAIFATGEWLDFAAMIVPGVALGAFVAARRGAEFHWEAFDDPREMRRHILGAVLMGTGGVLAGGCTIGQGLTAGSLMAPTWPIAALGMFAGARLGILILVEGPVSEIVSSRCHQLKERGWFGWRLS